MKILKLIQNPSYTLRLFKDSTWVQVQKREQHLGLVMDLSSAYQVVYQDIKENGGVCEPLSRSDFKRKG